MFDRIETAPADPILGLTAAHNEDPNPDKVNMTVMSRFRSCMAPRSSVLTGFPTIVGVNNVGVMS